MARRGGPAAPEACQRGQVQGPDDRGVACRARRRIQGERRRPSFCPLRRRRLRMATDAVATESVRPAPVYTRVLLKLSGEALMGGREYGTDPDRVHAIAAEIAAVHQRGVEIAIVVGGGNIYRGLAAA